MLQPNMSNGDEESVNETGFEIFEFDSVDRFEKTDRELKEMKNFVEECPIEASHKMKLKGKLGLEANRKRQIDDVSESTKDVCKPKASRCLHTSQSPHHPPINIKTADFGSQSDYGMDSTQDRASDLLMSFSVCADPYKLKIKELATAAMEELTAMALEGEPLWRREANGQTELLNESEYMRKFDPLDATLKEIIDLINVGDTESLPNYLDNTFESSKEGEHSLTLPEESVKAVPLRTEASRATGFLFMHPIRLVEWLMDVKQWAYVFSNIISKAMVLGFQSVGVDSSFDGALQVMTAEFHIPTPLVPARETYFARYCKQLGSEMWGIVDVSLDNIFPNPLIRFRKRPSGCVIQGMPNGYSKVIWVEHVEADTRVLHNIFQPLVASGYAFCANRWIASLIRQSERLFVVACENPNNHVELPRSGRESLFRLADRMMRGFCADVCGSAENTWTPLPVYGFEDVKIMNRTNMGDPGRPPGTAILVATSFRVPASTKRVFNFLRDAKSRDKWDVLSFGHNVRETLHITTGHDPGTRISIIQVSGISTNKVAVLYLQESYSDSTGSYVVYAPMDMIAVKMVLNGKHPDYVMILPSGFAILPYLPVKHGKKSGGSIVTIAFQMMDENSTTTYIPPESVGTICKLIQDVAFSIKDALAPNHR